MKSQKIVLLCILAAALVVSSLGLAGCMPVPKDPYGLVDPFESNPTDPTKNNNDFPRASKITLTNDSATFNALLTTNDVDVYDLGAVAAGDRLIVDLDIQDRVLLNAAVAVFDSVGRIFYLNAENTQTASTPLTDANFPAFAPHFEFVVRQATSPLYLAVASLAEPISSPFGAFAGFTAGPYTVNLSIQRGGPVPQPVKQVVALQFDDSVVEYPPMEEFGQVSRLPPLSLVGLSGHVLDPAWWRPLIIMQVEAMRNQGNANFWTNFLAFANTVGLGVIPNLANVTAPQIYGLLQAEITNAIQVMTANPNTFTPGNTQWFGNNGFPWLNTFALYLGPGIVGTPGLNVWNNVLAKTYPTTADPSFSDFIHVTQAIKDRLDQVYAGLNIEFLVVGVDTIPTDVPVESLYMVSNATGTGLLGLSSTIDMGNQNRSDFAAIFGGEEGYNNALLLGLGNPQSMSAPADILGVVGTTGAHELGHTLGLIHTSSQSDLMARFGGGKSDLQATLSTAPIDSSMFPIGLQDSGLLLLLELGIK
jgi:hypothetical protein